MEVSDLWREKSLKLLDFGKTGFWRQGFNLKNKHLLCSTQPFSTLKIFYCFVFFSVFLVSKVAAKTDTCHNVYSALWNQPLLCQVGFSPGLVRQSRAARATLAAHSTPCQTPRYSSRPVLHCWSWCGCSGPLHKSPAIQQFGVGRSRSRQQSAPQAPGPLP